MGKRLEVEPDFPERPGPLKNEGKADDRSCDDGDHDRSPFYDQVNKHLHPPQKKKKAIEIALS